jgi:error-prone DNA polymerase
VPDAVAGRWRWVTTPPTSTRCSGGLWARYRRVARTAPAMLVRGTLERSEGVTNVVADKLEVLPLVATARSRDFR